LFVFFHHIDPRCQQLTFDSIKTYKTEDTPSWFVADDFDGDNITDLAIANHDFLQIEFFLIY